MNGIHDMGGMHGLGPIEIEADEPMFHAAWESRLLALVNAISPWGNWSIDRFRYLRETMPPADYLTKSYYEHWLYAYLELIREAGLASGEELASGRAAPGSAKQVPKLRPADAGATVHRGSAGRRQVEAAPRFQAGDRVVARNLHPAGHTRLPRYLRGKRGVIDRDHGVFVFADSNAHGRGEKPQHVYSVRFTGPELWGEAATANARVYADLWEDHLDPAS